VPRHVLIQFGHNDQPGKPGRSTDLASEYPANLKRYVDEVRAAGGQPVLVTPLTRRSFRDGQESAQRPAALGRRHARRGARASGCR
jgi:lysophospholipase L1-like esterase